MEQFLEALVHSLKHAGLEALSILPFLYVTYLGLELLERYAGERAERVIARSGVAGPALGALLGVIPQCGFSAAGAGLYAGRVLTTGTLLAVFLSTSDEMLPLLIASGTPLPQLFKILGIKVLVAMVAGFAVDLVSHAIRRRRGLSARHVQIDELCRVGHCECDSRPLPLASLIHTLEIVLTVFLVSLVLHTAVELIGHEAMAAAIEGVPLLGCLLAAVVGLIPNCAASVAITTLYLEGVLSAGAMLSGLLVGAGVGLLVLFRVNRPVKDSLRVTLLLLLVGLVVGISFDLLGLGALLGI
jgi:hypothetical protein